MNGKTIHRISDEDSIVSTQKLGLVHKEVPGSNAGAGRAKPFALFSSHLPQMNFFHIISPGGVRVNLMVDYINE